MMRKRIKLSNSKHRKVSSFSKTSAHNHNIQKLVIKRKKSKSKIKKLNLNLQHIIYKKKNYDRHTTHSRSKTSTNLIKKLKEKINSKRENIFVKRKVEKIQLFNKSISKNYLDKEKNLKSMRVSKLILSNSHVKIGNKKKIKLKKNMKKKMKKENNKKNANFNLKNKIHNIICDLKNQTSKKNKKNYPILFTKKNEVNSHQLLLNRFKKPRFQIYKKKNDISEEKYLKRKSQSIRNYFLKKIKISSQNKKIDKNNLSSLRKNKKKKKKKKIFSI